MINQYPLNRDHVIKIVEQKQIQLFEALKATSVGLIRMAADENTKNQAIQSISYYEELWEDAFNFHAKWKRKIIETSEIFMANNEMLNSELELIKLDFHTEAQTIYTALTNLKKKK